MEEDVKIVVLYVDGKVSTFDASSYQVGDRDINSSLKFFNNEGELTRIIFTSTVKEIIFNSNKEGIYIDDNIS